MKTSKSILNSKTFWINLLMALAVIIPELIDLGFNIPAKWSGLAIVVVNLILRLLTTQPITPIKRKSKNESV
jgi:hypothetical protein